MTSRPNPQTTNHGVPDLDGQEDKMATKKMPAAARKKTRTTGQGVSGLGGQEDKMATKRMPTTTAARKRKRGAEPAISTARSLKVLCEGNRVLRRAVFDIKGTCPMAADGRVSEAVKKWDVAIAKTKRKLVEVEKEREVAAAEAKRKLAEVEKERDAAAAEAKLKLAEREAMHLKLKANIKAAEDERKSKWAARESKAAAAEAERQRKHEVAMQKGRERMRRRMLGLSSKRAPPRAIKGPWLTAVAHVNKGTPLRGSLLVHCSVCLRDVASAFNCRIMHEQAPGTAPDDLYRVFCVPCASSSSAKTTDTRVWMARPTLNRRRATVWVSQSGLLEKGECRACATSLKYEDVRKSRVVAKSNGGTKTLDNLRVSCAGCNLACGTRPFSAFVAEKRQELVTRDPDEDETPPDLITEDQQVLFQHWLKDASAVNLDRVFIPDQMRFSRYRNRKHRRTQQRIDAMM